MLRIEKILAPVDLSGTSVATLHCAGALARRFQAAVTILCVGPAAETAGKLETLARTEIAPAPYRVETRQGDPARVIVELAARDTFDLIAMATHGYGPFRRLLLGSVTTTVLDQAACPVFTGAHLENAASACRNWFGNVLCAVDLGPSTERVAAWAGAFAAAVQSRLFLLHVVPGLGAREEDYFRREGDVGPAQDAYEQLTAVREKLGLTAVPIVAGGEVPEAIARQVSQLRADVLIAGRGAPAGRVGRLRSQALRIVRGAPSPVITV